MVVSTIAAMSVRYYAKLWLPLDRRMFASICGASKLRTFQKEKSYMGESDQISFHLSVASAGPKTLSSRI